MATLTSNNSRLNSIFVTYFLTAPHTLGQQDILRTGKTLQVLAKSESAERRSATGLWRPQDSCLSDRHTVTGPLYTGLRAWTGRTGFPWCTEPIVPLTFPANQIVSRSGNTIRVFSLSRLGPLIGLSLLGKLWLPKHVALEMYLPVD